MAAAAFPPQAALEKESVQRGSLTDVHKRKAIELYAGSGAGTGQMDPAYLRTHSCAARARVP